MVAHDVNTRDLTTSVHCAFPGDNGRLEVSSQPVGLVALHSRRHGRLFAKAEIMSAHCRSAMLSLVPLGLIAPHVAHPFLKTRRIRSADPTKQARESRSEQWRKDAASMDCRWDGKWANNPSSALAV
jgi:hypothetical protein